MTQHLSKVVKLLAINYYKNTKILIFNLLNKNILTKTNLNLSIIISHIK